MNNVLKLVILLGIFSKLFAQEWDHEKLLAQAKANPEIFEKIPLGDANLSKMVLVDLKKDQLVVDGEHVFDGIRFTTPDNMTDLDFVWYFNIPDHWAHWYILPLEDGEEMQGFKEWLNLTVLYETFDKPNEENRFRALQMLNGENLQPGRDYVLWFRKFKEGEENDLRVKIGFAKKVEEWDHEAFEEALHLSWSSADHLVEQLDSRGGRMLLDDHFFDPDYAESRIKSVFDGFRSTHRLPGGFFITVETTIPLCRRNPNFKDLEDKYGAPDFIETAEQKKALEKFIQPDSNTETINTTRYYYDYFAFEVKGEPGDQKVQRVLTHVSDYSRLKPEGNDATFNQLGMKNLTVFHKEGKEVGRIFYFDEGSKIPFVLKEPPPDTYSREGTSLEFMGDGVWKRTDFSGDGKRSREIFFEQHLMNGTAKGYYYDTNTLRWEAPYQNGILHGTVVEYEENGEVLNKITYKNGERLEP